MRFTEHIEQLNNTINKGNIFAPPTNAQDGINFLVEYLLGENWYDPSGASDNETVNTTIIHTILYKYSRKYRKEYKRWIKENINKKWVI